MNVKRVNCNDALFFLTATIKLMICTSDSRQIVRQKLKICISICLLRERAKEVSHPIEMYDKTIFTSRRKCLSRHSFIHKSIHLSHFICKQFITQVYARTYQENLDYQIKLGSHSYRQQPAYKYHWRSCGKTKTKWY